MNPTAILGKVSHRPVALPFILIVASAACWAALALVAWGTGGPLLGTQDRPALGYDSTENQFLRAWEESDGTRNQLTTDLLSGDGASSTNEQTHTSASGNQEDPSVAYDPTSGGFLVAWADLEMPRVAARLIGADGDPAGSIRTITSGEPLYADAAVAANSEDGGFLVAWEIPGGSANVFARRVRSNGTTQGGQITIDDSAGLQLNPAVAFDPANAQFLVVYDYEDASGGIQGRLVDASDGSTGSILTGISGTAAGPGLPDVAFDADNERYFVIWFDTDADAVEGRLLDPDGEPLDGVIDIASSGYGSAAPAIAFDPVSCEYLAVWEDNNASTPDIVGQRFDVGGGTSGGIDVVIANNGSGIFDPAVAANSTDGGFLVVAVDEDTDPDSMAETFVSASTASGWGWPPRGGSGWLGVGLAAAALMGLLLLAAIRRARPLRPALATTLAVLLLNVAVLGVVVACDTSSGGGGGSEHSCLEE